MLVGLTVWAVTVVFAIRAEPKNQTRSFQIGPPRVASYRGFTFWTRVS